MPVRFAVVFLFACIFCGALSWRATQPAPPASRPGEPPRRVLSYMTWGNPAQRALEQRLLDRFMALNPDLEVRMAHVPSQSYTMKLNVMLASGTAPDVMRIDHYLFPAYVRKGHFLDLEPVIRKWKPGFDLNAYLDQFVPEAVAECKHNGSLHAMNMLFGAQMIYFNRNLFDDEGLTDPYTLYARGEWTKDAFDTAAKRLTKFDERGHVTQYGVRVSRDAFWPLLWCDGGDVLTRDLRAAVVNTPETIAALEHQSALVRQRLSPSSEQDRDPLSQFESGRIAMDIGWSGQAVRLREHPGLHFDWDIVPLYSGPGGGRGACKGNQLVIASTCPNPVDAWRLIEFLVSEEAERELYVISRRATPTRRALLLEFSTPQRGEMDPVTGLLRVLAPGDPGYAAAPTLSPAHPHVYYDCVIKHSRRLPIDHRFPEWHHALTSFTDTLHSGRADVRAEAQALQRRLTGILNGTDY